MPADPVLDLSQYVLRPTEAEIRDTKVLYFARFATDPSEEQARQHGYSVIYQAALGQAFEMLGLNATAASDPETLFGPLDYDFVYHVQLSGALEGKELLTPCIAAFRGVPFLGAPAPMRALSEDKILAKAMAASLGLNVAEHQLINPHRPEMAAVPKPGKWILKPRNGVMSRDVILIEDEAGWPAALAEAAHHKHEARDFIAEAFVPGLNLTVPVVEGFPPESLPVFIERGESRNNILTEDGKDGRTPDYASGPYDGPGAAAASAAAARLAAAISPFDYARFDFRYDPEQDRLVFLEFNIVCMMGPAAVVPRAAALRGVDYVSLVGHVFTHSLRRQRMEL